MALSQGIVWEVRTTGSDSNGGGFLYNGTGTDYSQQDAAQYTASNLTVDAVTNTVVTSVSHSFVAADVGNIMQITAGAGFTLAFYQIISVAAGAATLDRSPAAVTTSGGTFAVGGALASPGMASLAKTANSPGTGSTCWIKAGTYTIISSSANVSGGLVSDTLGGASIALNNRWEGYQTTRGDKGTRPLLTPSTSLSMNSTTIFSLFGSLSFCAIDNIEIDMGTNTSTSVTGFKTQSTFSHIIRCKASRLSLGFDIGFLSVPFYYALCEASHNTSHGFGSTVVSKTLYANCVSHDNGGSGFVISDATLSQCISYNNSSYGYTAASSGQCSTFLDSIASSNGNDGFLMSATFSADRYINCVSLANSGYGFNSAAIGKTAQLLNCAAGGNATGDYNSSMFDSGMVTNFVSLTEDPFSSSASGDFYINNLSLGGARLRAVVLPATFPGGFTANYQDIGVVQAAEGSVQEYALTTVATQNDTRKVLGQSSPSAATLTLAYTVPALTAAVISTISVCNTNSSSITFRISARKSGANDALKQYLYYDTTIWGGETYAATLPIALGAGDTVYVYASSTGVGFSIFGCENA